MSQFGQEFEGDYNVLDWPHNPFFSVLLYAGIPGIITYLWLLLRTINLYWAYRKEYWSLSVCFAIGLFFSFFSSNNPF